MTKRTFLGIVVLLVALAGALAAQQQQPAPAAPAPAQQPGAQLPDLTFRAEVNYVEVDARVLDENGKFIGGLTAKDFQVFEDGKPQQVSISRSSTCRSSAPSARSSPRSQSSRT